MPMAMHPDSALCFLRIRKRLGYIALALADPQGKRRYHSVEACGDSS